MSKEMRGAALCSLGTVEANLDYPVKKVLKPLIYLKKVNDLPFTNPLNFRGASVVTTFVCTAGRRTQGVWQFLYKASQANVGVKLAEIEHPSLKKMFYCSGRVPIYVNPSFYRTLKLKIPIVVRRLSRDGRVTSELSTSSLRHAVVILTPEDFGHSWH